MVFGIESPLLEEAFPGYQAVNLGMYADLGTKITLDILADSLQEGDIVILAPEQKRICTGGSGCAEQRPEIARVLNAVSDQDKICLLRQRQRCHSHHGQDALR